MEKTRETILNCSEWPHLRDKYPVLLLGTKKDLLLKAPGTLL